MKLIVQTSDLLKALAPARPHPRKKKPKPVPVSLSFSNRNLIIVEAKHGLFEEKVPARGKWKNLVQLDGIMLDRVIQSWKEIEEIELSVKDQSLILVSGKSKSTLPLLEKYIEQQPFKRDPKHLGKPYITPDPVGKRVQYDDTWLFSARVPMPEKDK